MITIHKQLCGNCGLCSGICPALAIILHGWGLEIDKDKCISCGKCVTVCPTGALT
ncbi:MAG: 4Fe-4S binding protein [Candidatus Edwardsbacteria bacterium]|nr:4Fe-4S binding protein [Candidatus Edwardsbacteria bacterium]MBU1577561.1 4Fe-4S binding protein [Candidatus Edwardsbacteria bacterium]MBU2462501.1 4Fe-4S binding protein [Candidatus Edwardsbacteria bacterium]MBU2593656.1 4Fe-4S binding protein [Candidatus Edwardsbacteria bacterium]